MTVVLFVATVAVVASFWISVVHRAFGAAPAVRFAAGLGLWLASTLAVAGAGLLSYAEGQVSPAFLFIVAGNGAAVALAAGPPGRRLAEAVPLGWLVGLQAFRIPVELVLWRLSHDGVVPAHMSFEGRNPDILTGLLAVVVALWVGRGAPRAAVGAWNLLGVALLVNIVAVSVLCFPGPVHLLDGPPNLVPVRSPWVWLPVFLVPSAVAGHVLVGRRLWGAARARAAPTGPLAPGGARPRP